ncbi:MAG: L,D-transpeptidase, partial [candidate division WOR-3 bacterium]
MPTHLTSFLLLLFSFFLFFLGELIFPLERSIRFNIIARGKAIINYRKGIKELKEELKRSKERLSLLESEAESLKVIPEEDYLVIDLLRNRLFWKKGEKTLREILISTGRGDSLISGKKKWVFKTPTGILRILWKIKNPIWYKPDWAFLEE